MWACVYVLLARSRVLCHFSACPLSVQRFLEYWTPSLESGSCCLWTSYVLFLPSRVMMSCTPCCLSMHSCLPSFLGGPGARQVGQWGLLGSSELMSPWLMLRAGDISPAPSTILCWTQLILQVLLMWKLWRNGTGGYIAFSFPPSDFQETVLGGPSWERWDFSQETSAFSPLSITNAKKCRNQSEK